MAGKKQEAKKKEKKKLKRNEKRCHCLLYKTNGPSTCFPIWWLRVVYVHQIRLAMVGAKTAAQHQPFLAKCWQSNEMFPRFRHTQAKISSLVLISLRAKWKMRCTLCTCKIAFSKMKLWRKTSKYRMDGIFLERMRRVLARTSFPPRFSVSRHYEFYGTNIDSVYAITVTIETLTTYNAE